MQQVNLYSEELRPRRHLFTFTPCVTVIGGITLFLLIVAAFLQARAVAVEQALKDASLREERIQSQIEDLQSRIELLVQDPEKVARNRRMEVTLRSRQELLRLIDTLLVAERPPFSEVLKGLARRSERDLWLTNIHIDAGGRHVRLAGEAASGQAVPDYLARLREEPSFAGRTFNLLALEPLEASTYHAFSLSTEAEAEEGP